MTKSAIHATKLTMVVNWLTGLLVNHWTSGSEIQSRTESKRWRMIGTKDLVGRMANAFINQISLKRGSKQTDSRISLLSIRSQHDAGDPISPSLCSRLLEPTLAIPTARTSRFSSRPFHSQMLSIRSRGEWSYPVPCCHFTLELIVACETL